VCAVTLLVTVATLVAGTASRVALAQEPTPTPAATPGGLGPFPAPADAVQVPALSFAGEREDDACTAQVSAQNVGAEASKALLLVWGPETACAVGCTGPIAARCSGLIAPGGAWHFPAGDLPPGAQSAVLFSFHVRSLSQIGVDLGFDDTVADFLCEMVFFGVAGDCGDYRRFRKAFDEGLEFGGVPLARAYGAPLAVDVRRGCPGDRNKLLDARAAYDAPAGRAGFDPIFGGAAYFAPALYSGIGGFDSVLHIQNAGSRCASVEVWFVPEGGCSRSLRCPLPFQLAPGSAMRLPAGQCLTPGWRGNAWIRATEPLGIVVDVVGRDTLSTYTTVPAELRYEPDRPPRFTPGSPVLYGPLLPVDTEAGEVRVHVQNLDDRNSAKVRMVYRDRRGSIVATISPEWLCARASRTFVVPEAVAGMPAPGAVQVESLDWWGPDGPTTPATNLSAMVEIVRPGADGRAGRGAAATYALQPEQASFDWPLGAAGDGATFLALPGLGDDGGATHLAVANLVPVAGATNVLVELRDANGVLGALCRQLAAREVAYLDLAHHGYLTPGLRCSALVSAAAWNHPVYDTAGTRLRNTVGLAAIAVEIGSPGGGDRTTVTTARPLDRRSPRPVPEAGGCPPLVQVPAPRPRTRLSLPFVATVGP
jgi:hypothetical protein